MTPTIEKLRIEIKKVDAEIIKKIAEREQLAKQIGELKAKAGKAIVDHARERELMNYYESLCGDHQLNTDFIKNLFSLIINNSRNLQSNAKK